MRRLTVEIDEALFGALELATGAIPCRVIVETTLQAWLDDQGKRSGTESILTDQAQASPATPSDAPKGRWPKIAGQHWAGSGCLPAA